MNGYPLDQFENKSELQKYACGICKDVCREASVLTCGHLFCKSCIHQAKIHCQDQCPVCRKEPMVIQDSPWHIQQIEGSVIHCSYPTCTFKDAVSRIKTHEAMCIVRPMSCDDCKETIPYLEWESHRQSCVERLVVCEICVYGVRFRTLVEHIEECPAVIVECECGDFVPRGELHMHSSTCPRKQINCCYHSYGCTVIRAREEMEDHERDPIHMRHLLQEIQRLHATRTPPMYPGELLTTCHPHPVQLRTGLARHSCDMCRQRVPVTQRFQTGVGYRCARGCDFDLCLSCFETYWHIPAAAPVVEDRIENEYLSDHLVDIQIFYNDAIRDLGEVALRNEILSRQNSGNNSL